MGRSRLCVLAFALFAGLASATPAIADEPIYTLPGAKVTAQVAENGSVKVTQELTFRFNREGHGAYVDIPRPLLSSLTDIAVSENGRPYRKGPDAEIGVERPADTFGEKTCSVDGAHRVVWYFDAEPGSTRTFRVDYTMHRAVTAHDRHAFLQLPVWGENWSQTLDRLDVTVRLPRTGLPGETYLAKGYPADVLKASVGGSRQVTEATAERVPGGHAVTLHLAFPAAQLSLPENPTATSPVRVADGDGTAELDRLRGGDIATSYPGPDCPGVAAGESDDAGSFGSTVLAFVLLPVIALILLVWFVRSIRGHGISSGSGYSSHHYTSTGSGDASGAGYSGGGGDSGGGGGAW